LRRIALIAVAVGMLVAAGAAYAASQINTYSATLKFTPKSAGTAAKPMPVAYTQDISAKGTGGNRTAVLEDIKTKIYGLKADGKDFPVCTLNQIAAAKNDTVCPAGAKVASGFITASVGAKNNFAQAGSACDPLLDVWNSGQGKLTFFFVDTPTHQCLGGALKTGSTGPYPATYKTQGKYLVVDVPVPSYIDFPAPGLAGSLETEHLVWAKKTAKVKGKTVAATSSIGCLGKKRPYSTTFTANLPTTGQTQTSTVKGSGACS
jgi:hypothetical protein